MSDLPGQSLFQYVDEAGDTHRIESSDVNAYIKEIAGEEFTAKDFRTWAGTVSASLALAEFDKFEDEKGAQTNIVAAVKHVAQDVGKHACGVPQILYPPGGFGSVYGWLDARIFAAKSRGNASERSDRPAERRSGGFGTFATEISAKKRLEARGSS
jgi:DNA topoisomerase IB